MKLIFPLILTLLLSFYSSYAMLVGSGLASPDLFSIIVFSLFILLLNSSRIGFWLFFPFCLLYALYTPVGLVFGTPSYQYVASVLATDFQEGKEFLAQIPLTHFIFALSIILSLLGGHWLYRKFQLDFYQRNIFVVAALLTLFFATPPAAFLRDSFDALLKVRAEFIRLNQTTAIASQWGESRLKNARYDDYILIIGESARKDYHHAYGYPIENTPFMSSSNGVLIDGLTAAGTNTIASLKLMLTKPDTEKWEGNYAMNLIDLIKSAGIHTYWFSNQGYLGTFDTPISSFANKSDERIFIKSGDSFHQNTSDFALLPKFEQLLAQPARGKRFIVLHLYGSHPLSCDRLTDHPKLLDDSTLDKRDHNLNCYISTIHKTDSLLQQVHQLLQQNQQQHGRRFSMVYFADHGLSHQISEHNIDLLNTSKSKRHYDVPLFKVSSDDTERKVYRAMKSGLNFTNGIANWIGIENPHLDSRLDLFSPEHDPSDYGLQKIIQRIDAPDDPAFVIEPKK